MTRGPFRGESAVQAEWLPDQKHRIRWQAGHDRLVKFGHLDVPIQDRAVTEARTGPPARIRLAGAVLAVLVVSRG
ncbi:MAG: hypothetical protein ABSG53_22215 [Thermoguttaceae bacterium]